MPCLFPPFPDPYLSQLGPGRRGRKTEGCSGGGLQPVGGGAGGELCAAVVEVWLFKERRGS